MKKRPELIRQRLTSLKFRLEQAIHAWTIDDYWALLEFYVDILPVIVPAERCTIFILEMGTETIGSMIGTGLQKMRIEPPKDKSIAGKVISTGQAMIANDLDKSYGYHTEVDARTGFVTRNMVCAPIKSLTGHGVTGALQVLNRKGRDTFTPVPWSSSHAHIAVLSPSSVGLVARMTSLTVPRVTRVTRAPRVRSSSVIPSRGERAPRSS